MVGLTTVLFGLGCIQVITLALSPWGHDFVASDLTQGYLLGVRRFFATGSPYTPEQVTGPWMLGLHSFIHPPAALPLFALFLVLPLPLWWMAPIGLTTYVVWRLRPAAWAWPVMAACLAWPRSAGSILTGDSDIWAMAAVATGIAWGWPIVLLAIKPTFAPLALVAVRRRSAWIVGVALAVAMLPFASLWLDWLAVVRNAGLSPSYSLFNLPLVIVPLIAWLGSERARPWRRSTIQSRLETQAG